MIKWLFALLLAQSLLSPKTTVQHVTASPVVIPGAGGKVTLALDVTPNPGVHVYAAGAHEFTPVSLVLTPRAGVTAGQPAYPKADARPLAAVDDAPAYYKPFRITQPLTVSAKTGEVVVAGVLTYQSCDERVCYPAASLPVTWTVR
jgi:DsbC/DsbD-like thiol-disulfide interchange protein